MRPPLDIVYQDDDLAVINKPSGLLVHRSRIASEAREFAMQMLRDQIGQHVYPVHRLDRPTSGLLIFALSSEIATKMSESFATSQVEKQYHAVVRGYLPEEGTVDYPLKEELDKIADAKADKDKEAQEAVTHFAAWKKWNYPLKSAKSTTRRVIR